MHFVYMDDSKGDRHVCFSAICFPAVAWSDALDHIIGLRRQMNKSDGIYMTKELHATEWLGGRGHVAPHSVPVGARARLFDFFLTGLTFLPSVQIFNAYAHKSQEERVFERLLNRIQANMEDRSDQALILSDQGKSYDFMLRKLRRINYIPSRFGGSRNVPLSRIVEDIIYKDSASSYFIQAADFCAFALLRFKHPTERLSRYGIDQSFRLLERALVKNANRADSLGLGLVYA